MPIPIDFTYANDDVGLIPMSVARAHLRVESDYPVEQITPYLAAAEGAAAEFLNRNVYRDNAALTTAQAALPAALQAAGVAYDAAVAASLAITDLVARTIIADGALVAYKAVQVSARSTYAGMVLNAGIVAAILLMLRHLFENRVDVVVGANIVSELPMGSRALLQPDRVEMGI